MKADDLFVIFDLRFHFLFLANGQAGVTESLCIVGRSNDSNDTWHTYTGHIQQSYDGKRKPIVHIKYVLNKIYTCGQVDC